MANSTPKNKYGFNTWPILFSLFTVIILISGFHYYQLSEDGLDLVCKGNSYGKDSSEDLDLLLSLETKAKQVSLDYQFFQQDKSLGKISFRGYLDTLDVASMTYRWLISEGDFQLSFG